VLSRGSEYSSLIWRKARRSVNNGACVEVAPFDGRVAIRDSKDPGGPALVCSAAQWQALIDGAKTGQYDHTC
jgi:hypothetical protein